MIRIILEGLMLGLSVGAYCLGACLAFFMPYLLTEGKQKVYENLSKIAPFMVGRLTGYIGFALIAGFIGTRYRNIFTAKVSNLSLIIASLLMLIYVLSRDFTDSKSCGSSLWRSGFMRMPFFLGLFTGLNPCIPFFIAVSRLWTLGSIFMGVILFAAFFAGTSVYMIPLVFVSFLNRIERVKKIGIIVALLSSIWFLFVGISGFVK